MWKDELNRIADFASNIDLYNTERLRRGELQELVVCLSDIIPFIESLLKQQRGNCAVAYWKANKKDTTYNLILNAPEPEVK